MNMEWQMIESVSIPFLAFVYPARSINDVRASFIVGLLSPMTCAGIE